MWAARMCALHFSISWHRPIEPEPAALPVSVRARTSAARLWELFAKLPRLKLLGLLTHVTHCLDLSPSVRHLSSSGRSASGRCISVGSCPRNFRSARADISASADTEVLLSRPDSTKASANTQPLLQWRPTVAVLTAWMDSD
jgi:hypothetical protein